MVCHTQKSIIVGNGRQIQFNMRMRENVRLIWLWAELEKYVSPTLFLHKCRFIMSSTGLEFPHSKT